METHAQVVAAPRQHCFLPRPIERFIQLNFPFSTPRNPLRQIDWIYSPVVKAPWTSSQLPCALACAALIAFLADRVCVEDDRAFWDIVERREGGFFSSLAPLAWICVLLHLRETPSARNPMRRASEWQGENGAIPNLPTAAVAFVLQFAIYCWKVSAFRGHRRSRIGHQRGRSCVVHVEHHPVSSTLHLSALAEDV